MIDEDMIGPIFITKSASMRRQVQQSSGILF